MSAVPTARTAPSVIAGFLSVLFGAAIFGFFYAWVCSTMWGLDATDPRVAMAAMQAMNASVRNPTFFPAFFLTPVVMGAAGLLSWQSHGVRVGRWFLAAALVYGVGGLLLTVTVNVPMNEALGRTPVPADVEAARATWTAYSGRWQVFNGVRTVASALSLLLAAHGFWAMARRQSAPARRHA